MSTTTPNMSLIKPDVGTEPGPDWAQDLNDSLDQLDVHDHTGAPNGGAQVPSAGLNINADLSFQNNDATNVRSVRLQANTSALAGVDDLRIVYSNNGELVYRDAAGNQVQITTGGSVNAGAGAITGLVAPASAAFSGVTDTFSWFYDSGKLAQMANGDIQLFPYDGATTYAVPITIKAPTAIATPYSLTLPTVVPTATLPLTMSAAGVLAAPGSGSAALPTYAFNGDPDTGIFLGGANTLAISTGGTLISTLNTGAVVLVPPLQVADGTAGAPGVSFASDPDTGVYHSATNTLGIAAGTAQVAAFSTTGFQTLDGTGANPSISFLSDPDTGLVRSGSGSLAVIGNTVTLVAIGPGSTNVFSPQFTFADGAVGAPGLSFNNDGDTGIYRATVNQINFATGGSNPLTITAGAVVGLAPFTGSNGSAAAPSFAFSGDLDTGMYLGAANAIGLSCGGAVQVAIGTGSTNVFSSQFTVADGAVGTPGYAFNTDGDTGFYRPASDQIGVAVGGAQVAQFSASGLSLDGGSTSFKTAVFSGTIGSGASGTHVISGVIVAVMGRDVTHSHIMDANVSASFGYLGATSNTQAAVTNGSGVTITYRIMVVYQDS